MIGEPLHDRVADLGRREVTGILVVGLLVVAAAGLWYVRSLPRPIRVEAGAQLGSPGSPASAAPGTTAAEGSSPSPAPVQMVVHVAGWVHRPGVYRFLQGDRVVDAVEAAGGARAGADLTTLNMAALLADGQQVLVGRRGGAGGIVSGTSTDGSGTGPGGLVNVNVATLEELEALPGIGPALGQRIIDHREEHGPFHVVDDLMNVSGIGEKTMEDLRPLVTV